MQEQSFFHDALQINGRDCIRFDQNEYFKDTSKALVVALKKKQKNSRLFTIFPDFISIFQTFFRSGKLLGKFQDFFKNLRLSKNPADCNQDIP